MLLLRVGIASIACAVALAGSAAAQNKLAFVVGIDKYDNLKADAQLKKAVGDARAVGEALSSLGFGVIAVPNAARSEFNRRWQDFLAGLRPGDAAAVVFSGHGVEIDGGNFLLPRDVPRVRLGRMELLKRESLSLQEILYDLREKRTAFSFIVIDACRNNPFAEGNKSVGGARGLARVEPPEGTFIMFSAGAYQTALDRLDDDDKATTSVYTRTLLPLLKTKNLSLLDMADRVGEQVRNLAATVSHVQTPAFYSGVIGARRLCLAGCEPGVAPVEPPATDAPPPLSAAARAWHLIQNADDIPVLEAFRKQYGAANPFYDQLAASRIADLKRGPEQGLAMLKAEDDGKRAGVEAKAVAGRCFTIEDGTTVEIERGSQFCSADGRQNGKIVRVDERDVRYSTNGGPEILCRFGELCGFDFPTGPVMWSVQSAPNGATLTFR